MMADADDFTKLDTIKAFYFSIYLLLYLLFLTILNVSMSNKGVSLGIGPLSVTIIIQLLGLLTLIEVVTKLRLKNDWSSYFVDHISMYNVIVVLSSGIILFVIDILARLDNIRMLFFIPIQTISIFPILFSGALYVIFRLDDEYDDEPELRQRALEARGIDPNITIAKKTVETHAYIPEVFISFSSSQVEIGEELHSMLRELGVRPWISSKNIDTGQKYNEQILGAIDTSKIFVLLITRTSVESRHVLSELERGFSHNCIILPVKLDPVEIPKDWEYYLNLSQWSDFSEFHDTSWIPDFAKYVLSLT